MCDLLFVFFFKQKTAYEMRISDWSSDVCSSDLDVDDDIVPVPMDHDRFGHQRCFGAVEIFDEGGDPALVVKLHLVPFGMAGVDQEQSNAGIEERELAKAVLQLLEIELDDLERFWRRQERHLRPARSEEQTSELQSLMRNSY